MIKKGTVCLFIWCFLLYLPINSMYGKEQVTFPISGQAAILMEQESGRVLYGKNEHQPLKIASITKIMTAILAIESGKLDETVLVSKHAEGTEGSSLYLVSGEKMKLEDLVYGLMMRSGNDAAIAIAEHVGGSVDGFVYLMNEKAKEIGMSNTLFRNPHGLDTHDDHLSSAYDMAILTQYAMTNETFQTISSTKKYRSQGENVRVFHNKNRLLTEKYDYSTGGKTGYTKLAKRTLVSTASKDGLNLITVTLNDPNDWDDHMNLFNWGFKQFTLHTLIEAGPLDVTADEFYEDHLTVKHELVYPLSENEKTAIKPKIELKAPPEQGFTNEDLKHPVGKMVFVANGEELESTPLYYEEGEKEEKRSFWQTIRQLFTIVIGAGST
ncbi:MULTISPECIES: D-alanyl-D-alanine carboxypeptidase family protein [Shouchella]|uniref:serine-type D-Ala-D-Ala carboxypeptidase n=2 Tax=Shouchella TaxID=2893057 RepID=A0ABY7W7Y1_9BACI|nr:MULTISPECIES: D-alanyl-D-alanine carboxypeptidase family protein [Shouchella]MED4127129.1 D-alanyl-D-alanine carboxypeptidase [Shouchella miscanthi]WDF03613.1 D-alanyl-D-alanine carboxypeptidase [Shouchella hunanensis]